MKTGSGTIKKFVGPFTWYMAANYLFVLPALAMFLLFNFYPYIQVFYLSVFKWNGLSLSKTFVDVANYSDILFDNPAWWTSMKNAAYVTGLALTVQNGVALLLAWLVDRDIRGGQIYRSIFFLPPILSGI